MTEKKPVSYETMFIIRPNLDEDAVDRSINGVFIENLSRLRAAQSTQSTRKAENVWPTK